MPQFIIIIDPGADSVQVEEVNKVVTSILSETPVPVYLFFTHCHLDHFLALPLLEKEINPQIVCHEITAKALEERDTSITMADMIDAVLPEIHVAGRFFHPSDHKEGVLPHPFAGEGFRKGQLPGHPILTESFSVGNEDVIELFHTPGHSPDGVSYKVGRYLITGDLHLATTPGIVGLTGWENEKLAASLDAMIEVGKRGGVEVVLPGHGIPFAFERAEKIFQSVKRDALRLSGLILLNRERADYLSEFAIVLLKEASTMFSTIAARLLKVTHYLELLEEEEDAGAILQSLDLDAIDNIVEEFHSFIEELKGEGGVPLISKAVQFVKSVEKVFEPEKVSYLFDQFLLRRLRSLLMDFVNSAYGIRFQDQETIFDVNRSIRELIEATQKNPHESDSILDNLEDDLVFVKALTQRMAYTPLFASTHISFETGGEPLEVLADYGRFQDTLSALLEQAAILGADEICLECHREEDKAVLKATLTMKGKDLVLSDAKLAYLTHSMRLAGGVINSPARNNTPYYTIELPLALTSPVPL